MQAQQTPERRVQAQQTRDPYHNKLGALRIRAPNRIRNVKVYLVRHARESQRHPLCRPTVHAPTQSSTRRVLNTADPSATPNEGDVEAHASMPTFLLDKGATHQAINHRLAFQRPTGQVTPDIQPTGIPASRRIGAPPMMPTYTPASFPSYGSASLTQNGQGADDEDKDTEEQKMPPINHHHHPCGSYLRMLMRHCTALHYYSTSVFVILLFSWWLTAAIHKSHHLCTATPT